MIESGNSKETDLTDAEKVADCQYSPYSWPPKTYGRHFFVHCLFWNGVFSDVKMVEGKVVYAGSAAVSTYTVQKGDSLWAIAEKHLGNGTRYNEIKKLNGLTSDVIYAGQVLKLPN